MKSRSVWTFAGLMVGLAMPTFASSAKPALAVKTLGGTVFDLRAQRGHWVVINYWSTQCAPCLEEMPMLGGFAKAHSSVRLLGLTYQQLEAPELRRFVAEHHPGYPIALIHENQLPHTLKPSWFGIHALPMTYVIAPDGEVFRRFVGEIDRAKLEGAIAGGQ